MQQPKDLAEKVIENLSEDECLKRDMNRTDMENFVLFTQMLRRNIMLKNAIITHK